ncbi:hypothetical protein BXO471_18605, partial [Xanthomonas oryzae pv. oryzae]
GADGALTTAVDAGYMPIPSTGSARLAVNAVVFLAAPSATACHAGALPPAWQAISAKCAAIAATDHPGL